MRKLMSTTCQYSYSKVKRDELYGFWFHGAWRLYRQLKSDDAATCRQLPRFVWLWVALGLLGSGLTCLLASWLVGCWAGWLTGCGLLVAVLVVGLLGCVGLLAGWRVLCCGSLTWSTGLCCWPVVCPNLFSSGTRVTRLLVRRAR